MVLDGLQRKAPISGAPGGVGRRRRCQRGPPRPIGTQVGIPPGRQSGAAPAGLGRSAQEEIVRRLDRTIRAAQLARDLLRCQHDLAHGFFNG